MEILSGDQKLIDEIISDARTKAERLLKKAVLEASQIDESLKKEIEKLESEMNGLYEQELHQLRMKIFSGVDVDLQKKKGQFTKEFFQSVFHDLAVFIRSDENRFRVLISGLILEAALELSGEEVTVFYGKESEVLIDRKRITNTLQSKAKKIRYESVNKPGITVKEADGKKGVYLSLDELIHTLEIRERNRIYEILTGKGSRL
jgi:vacuolar-type H+-ATPase subunit E/Vma4